MLSAWLFSLAEHEHHHLVAPFDYTQKDFNATTADCVWSPLCALCPLHAHCGAATSRSTRSACLPIEPLRSWHKLKKAKRLHSTGEKIRKYVSYLDDSAIIYRFELQLQCARPPPPRRVYIDVGANAYWSSIGEWFMKRYANASAFQILALEANPDIWHPSFQNSGYRQHPEVELHQWAAWVENTTMDFAGASYSGRLEPPNHTNTGDFLTGRRTIFPRGKIQAVDLAALLAERVSEEDYLVLKMDVEGAEFRIVPHLIRTGATRLIDEFFLESKGNDSAFAEGRTSEDSLDLLRSMRAAGVYAHQWG